MPDPPERSSLEHMLLEEPLLLVITLVVAGLVLGWHSMREGLHRRVAVAASMLVAAGAILGIAARVTTAAEHGAAAVERFVDAVAAGDAVAVDLLLDQDASVHSGRETNPGLPRGIIVGGVSYLRNRGLESVSIGSLESWPDGRGGAIVHLSASARASDWPPTGSRWVLRVAPDSVDGTWRITQLTWIDLMGQPPPAIPRVF